jgi:NadR type nicotinamide-nucleotide adenylyltransferase
MIRRIAITGPESTGKTWLSKKLAQYFNTVWVEEYAREYLQSNGQDYRFEDIVKIAEGQKKREEALLLKANKMLFSDTEPVVTKIWSEVVFGKCDRRIENEIINNPYDLYLLCYPDLPWEPDPLRENPDNRLELFELYRKELLKHKLNFKIVKGNGEKRFENARRFVEGGVEG